MTNKFCQDKAKLIYLINCQTNQKTHRTPCSSKIWFSSASENTASSCSRTVVKDSEKTVNGQRKDSEMGM